jgi:hypothetical protein
LPYLLIYIFTIYLLSYHIHVFFFQWRLVTGPTPMRPVNVLSVSAPHTQTQSCPPSPLLLRSSAVVCNGHGNAVFTRARHPSATAAAATTTTTTTANVSPAQPHRPPTPTAAAGQPCWPIRSPRHSAVYLCSPYQKTEHSLRPMQVCFPLLSGAALIAHSNALFAILEGAARFAAIVSQVQTRYYALSSVHIARHSRSVRPLAGLL